MTFCSYAANGMYNLIHVIYCTASYKNVSVSLSLSHIAHIPTDSYTAPFGASIT